MAPISANDLTGKKCRPCERGTKPFSEAQIRDHLAAAEGWAQAGVSIERRFTFKNYYETVSFVNAVAWICHREDHHPDIEFGYKKCRVAFSTHAAGGLTENDFICAAKVNALLKD